MVDYHARLVEEICEQRAQSDDAEHCANNRPVLALSIWKNEVERLFVDVDLK